MESYATNPSFNMTKLPIELGDTQLSQTGDNSKMLRTNRIHYEISVLFIFSTCRSDGQQDE